MKENKNLKAQGSTEYILMLAGAIIVAIVILVFVFKIGGTAAKSGGIQVELIAAESSNNNIAIATSIPLVSYNGVTANIEGTGEGIIGGGGIGTFESTVYNVPGGYEYELTDINLPPSVTSITSIIYTTANGQTVTIVPESGSSVPIIPNGSFPFTISQIS